MSIAAASYANMAGFFTTLRALKQTANSHRDELAIQPIAVSRLLDARRALIGLKAQLVDLYQGTPGLVGMIHNALDDNLLDVQQQLNAISASVDAAISAINSVVPIYTANGLFYPLIITSTADGNEVPVTVPVENTALLRQRLDNLSALIS